MGIGIIDGDVSYVYHQAGQPFSGVALGIRWLDGFPFAGSRPEGGGSAHYVSGVAFDGVETRLVGTTVEYRYTSQESLNLIRDSRKAITGSSFGKNVTNSALLAKSFLAITDSLGRPVGYFNEENIKAETWYAVPRSPTPAELVGFKFGTRALFESLPEVVDYTFAGDVFGPDYDMDDARMRYLRWLLNTGGASRPEYGNLLPWRDLGDYVQRRSVAKYANNRIREYSSFWINPENPGGGSREDQVDALIEQRTFWADVQASTRTTAGGAGRELTGQQDYAGVNQVSQVNHTCMGTSCTSTTNTTLTPVTVVGSVRIVDRNAGESDYVDLISAERPVVFQDGTGTLRTDRAPVDPSQFGVGNANYRAGEGAGFAELFMTDTSSDRIQVNIELNREHREDYKFHIGSKFGDRRIPAFGYGNSVWTYDLLDGGRAHRLNDPFPLSDPPPGVPSHYGYRQPGLSRAYYCGVGDNSCLDAPPGDRPTQDSPGAYTPTNIGGSFTDSSVSHIRWPVNLQDMNWYLYQLPGRGPETSEWLLWVHDSGARHLIHSGYGLGPAVTFPACEIEGEQTLPGGNVLPGDLLSSRNIECTSTGTPPLEISDPNVWDPGDVAKGQSNDVFFPFDAAVDVTGFMLDEGTVAGSVIPDGEFGLVKAGVESPVDVGEGLGSRNLNRFSFVIHESNQLSVSDVEAVGYSELRRHGVPGDPARKRAYLDDWRSLPVSPNRPYLMVITFYESLQAGGTHVNSTRTFFTENDDSLSEPFALPKRHIRRVVCRLLIVPNGFSFDAEEQKNIIQRGIDSMLSSLGNEFQQLSSWISSALRGLSTSSLSLARRGGEAACFGMVKLDQVTALTNVRPSSVQARGTGTGILKVNEAARSRNQGIDQCKRVATPPEPVCNSNVDLISQATGCVNLPKMRMLVRDAEFLDLSHLGVPGVLPYREYRGGQRVASVEIAALEDSYFFDGGDASDTDVPIPEAEFVQAVGYGYDGEITNRNVGLTRVRLAWEFESSGVSENIYDAIDGYVVYAYPDERSSPYPSGDPLKFILPRWVREDVEYIPTRFVSLRGARSIDGFSVGGLNSYPGDQTGSNALSRVYNINPDETGYFSPIGPEIVENDYRRFNYYVDNMPLAPGFVHRFVVAPYVGTPGKVGFKEGPPSDPLTLDGSKTACLVPNTTDVTSVESHLKRTVYRCDNAGDTGYVDPGPAIGLLNLTGTDICRDIFSSTPAGFTWDNPYVKQVWGLMWIIAGGVLFSLLVWQGLRMTYDIWVDPQPIVGFRELIPRFLLAIFLAAGSLIICRLVLVIASDLTCFVAQMLGMSMWGVVGTTFGAVMDGYLSWAEGAVLAMQDVTLSSVLKLAFRVFFGGLLVVILVIGLLILFFKVALGMVLRIAFLAVLIALSPLAFAFYASDSTSHWTKKWVSMFLGSAFQQVVVLIVIYLGGHMMSGYFSSADETGLSVLLIGLLIGFATLALADKVPEIVNPAGRGMFSSIGQMGSMAVAGGVIAASAGVGALAMPAISAARGFGGAWQRAGEAPPGAGGGPQSSASSPSPSGVNLMAGTGSGSQDSSMRGLSGTTFASGPQSGSARYAQAWRGSSPDDSGDGSGGPSDGSPPPGTPPSGAPTGGPGSPPSSGTGPGAAPIAPVASPGGAEPSSGASPVQPAGGSETGSPEPKSGVGIGGFVGGAISAATWLPRQMVQGARGGARWGSGANTRMYDAVSGRSLYSHSSRADDAAMQQQRAREERRSEGEKTRGSYDRMSDVLERLEGRL